MNILPVNNCKTFQYTRLIHTNPAFQGKHDELHISYVEKIEKNNFGGIESIQYKYPLPVANVFKNMACKQDPFMEARFLAHLHSPEEIKEISNILAKNPEIGNINVKALIGLGTFAYVFETENGLALKIVQGAHFPDKRPPADFDFPIIKSGKIAQNSIYYYFLEEIARQDNLKDSEIFDLIKHIQAQGYSIVDYYSSNNAKIFNHKQFGRASDGKVYLLDPGCAITKGINKTKNDFVKRILDLIKKGTR